MESHPFNGKDDSKIPRRRLSLDPLISLPSKEVIDVKKLNAQRIKDFDKLLREFNRNNMPAVLKSSSSTTNCSFIATRVKSPKRSSSIIQHNVNNQNFIIKNSNVSFILNEY